MKATLRNYRQSPRKVRLVADLIKGKRVDHALVVLSHTKKRAARQMVKILDSAAANAAQQENLSPSELYIKHISVDEGMMLKRFMPRAFGRATPILKRSSHINIELGKEAERSKRKGQSSEFLTSN